MILKKKFLFVHFHVTKNGLLHCTIQQSFTAVGNRSESQAIVEVQFFGDFQLLNSLLMKISRGDDHFSTDY
jgi:hypothetical protein